MADFKTALEALASGQLELDSLSNQLSSLLNDNPRYANKLLAQLEHINDQGSLENHAYTELKRQINEFRRAHASETEVTSSVSEAWARLNSFIWRLSSV